MSYGHTFKEPAVFLELIRAYNAGMSLLGVAARFDVDRSSVRYHLLKHGVYSPGSARRRTPRPHDPATCIACKQLAQKESSRLLSAPSDLAQGKIFKYQELFDQDANASKGKTYVEYAAHAGRQMYAKYGHSGAYPAARKRLSTPRRKILPTSS